MPGLAGEPGRRLVMSLPTDSVARLQVHVGRRANVDRGALTGGLAGVALGGLRAAESEGTWALSPRRVWGATPFPALSPVSWPAR
jgi:hypothetical protein